MTRDEAVAEADRILLIASRKLPVGARVVVVVTGGDGEFVGVGHNTTLSDVHGILACALRGEEYQRHVSGNVIDMQPAEPAALTAGEEDSHG